MMADPLSENYSQFSSIMATQALEMEGLSHEEYFKKIEEMVRDLKQFWREEQRVKSLKVAIQLSKLLADTNQMKAYAKKYKIIVEALDEFGQLVYARIHSKANGPNGRVNYQLNSGNCSGSSGISNNSVGTTKEQAKETCRNWFLKVASIRELVPRYYTELSILKTCDILLEPSPALIVSLTERQFFPHSLRRLTKIAWGFGDPIVALYARLYLCRVAARLISSDNEPCSSNTTFFEVILENIDASTLLISRLDTSAVERSLQAQKIGIMVFFELISGALQSMLTLVTARGDVYTEDDHLTESAKIMMGKMLTCMMNQLKANENCPNLARSIILHSTFKALHADIIAEHSEELLDKIQEAYQSWQKGRLENDAVVQVNTFTLYIALESFALALEGSENFESDTNYSARLAILNSIQSIVENLLRYETNHSISIGMSYLRCFKAWFSYATHYVDLIQVDSMLGKFVNRMKKDRKYVNHYSILVDLVRTLVASKRTIEEFQEIFKLKSFSQLLEMLRKDNQKLEASKWVLETMRANLRLYKRPESSDKAKISNKQMIDFILRLFSNINDSLSLLSAEDDFEHLSQLVIYFLDIFAIQDYKEHLELFSRCRSSLDNLNPVLEYLARRALELAAEFRNVERKRGQRQNYLNGCLAFSFVTIPALRNPLTRINLLVEGARLALNLMSLSLADYYLKQALVCLNEELQLLHASKQAPHTVDSFSLAAPDYGDDSKLEINKPLLEQVHTLLNLMFRFEDHIDLKHKLVLANLIKNSLGEHSSLIESMNRLNIVDCSDTAGR